MNLSYFLNKKINLAILTLLLLSINFVSAWTGPPGAPPACPAGSVGCAELLDVNKDQSIGGIKTFTGTAIFNNPITIGAPISSSHAVTKGYVDSVSGAIPLGRTSGDTGTGYLLYAGTTRTPGRLYGGTTAPSGTIRLNYDGYLYATQLYDGGTRVAISTRNIGAGDGLSGGGDLTANRTLSVNSTVVRTTGNQTLAGTKTFSSPVVVAPPLDPTHAATKGYVDSAIVNIGIGGYVPTSRTISTTNGITGGGDLTANRTLSLDSTVVRTTGDQTIGGIKTFSSTISGSITGNAGTVGGLSVHAGRNNEANKVVRTDGSGYIQAGWINTTSGNNGTTAPDRIYASNDAYIRYYTPANFATVMNTWLVRTSGDQTIAGVKTFSSVIRGPNGTAAAPAFTFSADTNTGIYSGGTDILRFSTAGADRLTILANGNVGIGTTSPTQKLEVNGDVIANAYYYLSDIRKKENVTNIENSLSKILQLQGISYNLKGEEDKRMGFSAQELQKVYPELVKEGSDGYLSIDGTGLIAPLVESIKEQQKKIEELEEKINILMQK